MTSIAGKEPSTWEAKFPLIRELVAYQETAWFNPGIRSGKAALTGLGLTVADIDDAAACLRRFAPYIAQVFPETRLPQGSSSPPCTRLRSCRPRLNAGRTSGSPGNSG